MSRVHLLDGNARIKLIIWIKIEETYTRFKIYDMNFLFTLNRQITTVNIYILGAHFMKYTVYFLLQMWLRSTMCTLGRKSTCPIFVCVAKTVLMVLSSTILLIPLVVSPKEAKPMFCLSFRFSSSSYILAFLILRVRFTLPILELLPIWECFNDSSLINVSCLISSCVEIIQFFNIYTSINVGFKYSIGNKE